MGEKKRRLAAGAPPPDDWTWHRGIFPPIDPAYVAQIMIDSGLSEGEVRQVLIEVRSAEVWMNSRYQVNISKTSDSMIQLSIKRRDKQPLGPERYRHLQRIKNELVGPEHEGVELYPAETRLLDTANQYQMFVMVDPTYRFPFGQTKRAVSDKPIGRSVQQPFEE
jgi:hypothetical protein